MMDCQQVQEQLAGVEDPGPAPGSGSQSDSENGPVDQLPLEAREHLANCPVCREFARALQLLDSTALALPRRQPSDALLARTLTAVRAADAAHRSEILALADRRQAELPEPELAERSPDTHAEHNVDIDVTHGWLWVAGLAAAAAVVVMWTVDDQSPALVTESRVYTPAVTAANDEYTDTPGWRRDALTPDEPAEKKPAKVMDPMNGTTESTKNTGGTKAPASQTKRGSTKAALVDNNGPVASGEGEQKDEPAFQYFSKGQETAESQPVEGLDAIVLDVSGAISSENEYSDDGNVAIVDKPRIDAHSRDFPLSRKSDEDDKKYRNGDGGDDDGAVDGKGGGKGDWGGEDTTQRGARRVPLEPELPLEPEPEPEPEPVPEAKSRAKPKSTEIRGEERRKGLQQGLARPSVQTTPSGATITLDTDALDVDKSSQLELRLDEKRVTTDEEPPPEANQSQPVDELLVKKLAPLPDNRMGPAPHSGQARPEKKKGVKAGKDRTIEISDIAPDIAPGTHEFSLNGRLLQDRQQARYGEFGKLRDTDRWWSGRKGNIDGRARLLARALLDQRQATTGVATHPTSGLWANTYVPGDPVLRLLHGRLAKHRLELGDASAQLGALDASVQPYRQAFDPPKTAALGLSVRADRRVADGPTRTFLQVGLQGTPRRSGRRPAMNIAVVLDLHGAENAAAKAGIPALLSALREAKQTGDRFSLVVAGVPGAVMLTPDQFRHGPLTVAVNKLFGGAGVESSGRAPGPVLTLDQALARATREVASRDDSAGPLGTSLVLLLTGSTVSRPTLLKSLRTAHESAVNGIAMSVVGVGHDIDEAQLTMLATAGQGNRRLLVQTGDAANVIAAELAAAASVVARAVRVRVKLAPGVKLVGVVGSHRLDAEAARRVREAERSIDRRIERARGIVADREDDQDGVNIIIPSFLAGDSHVILLDVIAPGPGPLADVTVRYKDLVFLQNGVARGSLNLTRGKSGANSHEPGVFKNYVAHIISRDLRKAGNLLSQGASAEALTVLDELEALLRGLSGEVPFLRADAEFARDGELVGGYLRLLEGAGSAPRGYVSDSLQYAGWRKLMRAHDDSN